jgi:hypothetical protein
MALGKRSVLGVTFWRIAAIIAKLPELSGP